MPNPKGITQSLSKGFTLIELLIVIAILGILAAGVVTAINPLGKINSANLAKAKTFSASIENSLGIDQVGSWSFEETSSPSKDTSGYGNNGTWNGGITWNNAATCGLGLGGCLSFDGAAYVDTVSNSSLNTDGISWTISVWYKPNSLSPWNTVILLGSTNYTAGRQLTIDRFLVRDTDSTDNVLNTNAVAGKWNYVVVTHNISNKKLSLYRNGMLQNSKTYTAASLATQNENIVRIGREGGENYFPGMIDEVRIYSQALSSSYIQQLYAQGSIKHQLAKN